MTGKTRAAIVPNESKPGFDASWDSALKREYEKAHGKTFLKSDENAFVRIYEEVRWRTESIRRCMNLTNPGIYHEIIHDAKAIEREATRFRKHMERAHERCRERRRKRR